jgi:hypothetical protein
VFISGRNTTILLVASSNDVRSMLHRAAIDSTKEADNSSAGRLGNAKDASGLLFLRTPAWLLLQRLPAPGTDKFIKSVPNVIDGPIMQCRKKNDALL